jgi:subfamily B ATP-binding cassette protein MsbA
LSLFVGLLDGFGLAMFLPLLQMVDGSSTVDVEQMGRLSFLVEGIESLGFSLNLYAVLIIILFFFSFKGLMKFLEGYCRVVYQQFFIRNIRITNAELLSNFSYNSFVRTDSGRIQNTFSGEVERVNQAYYNYFKAIQDSTLVLVYIVLAFLSNPQFALLISVGGFLTNFIFKKLYRATKSLSKNFTLDSHEFQGLLIQKVVNFKYLKATGLIYQYVDKLKEKIRNIETTQRKIGILGSILNAIREPLTMLVVVVVIIIQVNYFKESLGLIILSLLFFYRALTFLMSVQNFWNNFLGVSGSLDNMSSFTGELKSGQEKFGKLIFKSFNSDIKFSNVKFSYGVSEDDYILKGVSFQLLKNETIAIVGESGSGKTTLVNILAGLIKPQNGTILIDEHNVGDLDIRSFQSRIGYITQEPVIFNDTIFNNVTFWDKKTSTNLKNFQNALEKASIYDFVGQLRNKEDTILGNNGVNLSGGQRQRISIARELYKKVDFLVMDEATSALDSETEKAIQASIDSLKGQYTIITIAHRLSTVKNADKIILLNRGEIEDIGSFNELMNSSDTFKKMVKLQEV